jgi:putative FmdB family regulatory protein
VPLYEYHCASCGGFELIQKFSDPPLKKCPRCGKRVKKQLSAPAIQFKGTGWYITDYARKSAAASDSAPAAGADGKPAAVAKADAAEKPEAGKKAAAPKGRSSA